MNPTEIAQAIVRSANPANCDRKNELLGTDYDRNLIEKLTALTPEEFKSISHRDRFNLCLVTLEEWVNYQYVRFAISTDVSGGFHVKLSYEGCHYKTEHFDTYKDLKTWIGYVKKPTKKELAGVA